MSKALTKDDADVVAVVVAPRAPLPPGVPNYVTPAGLASLRAELSRLLDERSASQGSREGPERERARLARAMLGKRVGDVATVKTPHGEEELTVVALADDDA